MRPLLLTLLCLSACDGASPWGQAKDPAASLHTKPRPPKAPRVAPLDGSTGGPLRHVSVADVVVSQDVLTQGSDQIAGTVAECDASFGSPLGQHWYTFSDAECYGGTSVSLLQLLHNGNDGMGCSLRWIGSLKRTMNDPFTGVGHDVTRVDLTQFKKIHLQVRGDGHRYRVQLPMQEQIRLGGEARAALPRDENGLVDCHEEYYDFFGQEFTCGDDTDVWAPLDVSLADLRQYGFGKSFALKLDDVEHLQIVSIEHEERDFQCEFKIVGME